MQRIVGFRRGLRCFLFLGCLFSALSVCAAMLSQAFAMGREGGKTQARGVQPVVVYSARTDHLIKPVFDLFSEQTDIPVQFLSDSAGPLLLRLQAEGKNTPADLLLTVDAGNLWQAAEQGVLRRTDSNLLRRNVPEHLRDPQGRWFGLTLRARTIVHAPQRTRLSELNDYAGLAAPSWRNRLCLRSGKKVYNLSLTASLLHHMGAERTLQLLNGWVRNLALSPFDSDTRAMEAVLTGRCDLTVVNSYYYGRLQRKWRQRGEELPLAIFWPGQTGSGVHVNISGAGITRHAKNPQAARQLLEWMSSPEAQRLLASLNLEYPVHPDVPAAPEVAEWGDFRADDLQVSELGRLQSEAARLIDQAGWN